MRCAWNAYLNLLPLWMREFVDKHGESDLLELRLRLGAYPELITINGSIWMQRLASKEDIIFCINAASRYSPWAAATTANGYITAPGGHRLGLCGITVVNNGTVTGISMPTSICLRVARDISGIARGLENINGSVLILGKPGSGKTTLLRDLIRIKSNKGSGSVGVVDEKCELFPIATETFCFIPGKKTDVLSGCSKKQGIEALLRNMCPQVIAVDEITADEDCKALMYAGWCGVNLLATAHAASKEDLFTRPVYRTLAQSGLFDYLVLLQQDKSWRLERMYK